MYYTYIDIWCDPKDKMKNFTPHMIILTEIEALPLSDCKDIDELSGYSAVELIKDEVIDWLKEYCTGNWWCSRIGRMISFENKEDAFAFKLRWS